MQKGKIEFNCIEDLILHIEEKLKPSKTTRDKFTKHLNRVFNLKYTEKQYKDRLDFLNKFTKDDWDNFQITLKSKQRNEYRDKSLEYLAKQRTLKDGEFLAFQNQGENTRGVPKTQKGLIDRWTKSDRKVEQKYLEIFNEVIMNKFIPTVQDSKNSSKKNINTISNETQHKPKSIIKNVNKASYNLINFNAEATSLNTQESPYVMDSSKGFTKTSNLKAYKNCSDDKFFSSSNSKDQDVIKTIKIHKKGQDPSKTHTDNLLGKRSKDQDSDATSEQFDPSLQNRKHKADFIANHIQNPATQEQDDTYKETDSNKLKIIFKEDTKALQNSLHKSDPEINSIPAQDNQENSNEKTITPCTETYVDNGSEDKKTLINNTEKNSENSKESKKQDEYDFQQVKIENAVQNDTDQDKNDVDVNSKPSENEFTENVVFNDINQNPNQNAVNVKASFSENQFVESDGLNDDYQNTNVTDLKVKPVENLFDTQKINKSQDSIEIVESLSEKDGSIIVKSENEHFENLKNSRKVDMKHKDYEKITTRSILTKKAWGEDTDQKQSECSFRIDKNGLEFKGNLTQKTSTLLIQLMKNFRNTPSYQNNVKIEPSGKM